MLNETQLAQFAKLFEEEIKPVLMENQESFEKLSDEAKRYMAKHPLNEDSTLDEDKSGFTLICNWCDSTSVRVRPIDKECCVIECLEPHCQETVHIGMREA